jgi:PAS domain S-box-containing protein
MTTPIMLLLLLLSTLVLGGAFVLIRLDAHNRRLQTFTQGLQRRSRRRLASWLMQKATALAHQRAYWEQFKTFAAPVLVSNRAGEIVAGNYAVLEMLGFGSDEELKRHKAGDLYADSREREFQIRGQVSQRGILRNTECRFRRADGTIIHALASIRTMESPEQGMLFEEVFTDVSELRSALEKARKLESQLLMAQKLEAIGQLAAGIAHEINTPIQFVGDNTHFLRDCFNELSGVIKDCRKVVQAAVGPSSATSELLRALTAIEESAHLERLLREIPQALAETFDGIERVTETVRAMKEFAHPDDGEMAPADINQAVQTTLVVARNEYKHIADIVTDFGDLPEVLCRKGEINKLVLNLVVNAAHAMEQPNQKKRGTITIATREAGDNVQITIADSGCGIPAAIIGRIFDPFFTTKPLGKGTGQGLAIAKTIVTGHGGRIEVASTPGKGSQFTITLPIRRDRILTLSDPDRAVNSPYLSTGTAS